MHKKHVRHSHILVLFWLQLHNVSPIYSWLSNVAQLAPQQCNIKMNSTVLDNLILCAQTLHMQHICESMHQIHCCAKRVQLFGAITIRKGLIRFIAGLVLLVSSILLRCTLHLLFNCLHISLETTVNKGFCQNTPFATISFSLRATIQSDQGATVLSTMKSKHESSCFVCKHSL